MSQRAKLAKVLSIIVAAFALPCCCCVGLMVTPMVMDIPLAFATGWLRFLIRVSAEMTIDWVDTVTAVLAFSCLAVGLHCFLCWLFDQIQQSRQPTESSRRRWQMRWTAAMLGVVITMFVAGIAAVGLIHQTLWLLNSPEPIVDLSRRPSDGRSNNNLKLQALGAFGHQDSFHILPAGGTFDKNGRGLHGWQTALLPYLEQDALYKKIKLDLPWNEPMNRPHFRVVVPEFQYDATDNKESAGYAISQYASNVWVLGGGRPLDLKRDFLDGASNTLLFGEAAGNFRPWGHHANWRDPALGINTTLEGFGSTQQKSANFALADGSVRSLSNRTSRDVLKALSTPAGGEKLPADWDDQ